MDGRSRIGYRTHRQPGTPPVGAANSGGGGGGSHLGSPLCQQVVVPAWAVSAGPRRRQAHSNLAVTGIGGGAVSLTVARSCADRRWHGHRRRPRSPRTSDGQTGPLLPQRDGVCAGETPFRLQRGQPSVKPSRKLRWFESNTCHHLRKPPLTCDHAAVKIADHVPLSPTVTRSVGRCTDVLRTSHGQAAGPDLVEDHGQGIACPCCP
jgi:hypothetical protein